MAYLGIFLTLLQFSFAPRGVKYGVFERETENVCSYFEKQVKANKAITVMFFSFDFCLPISDYVMLPIEIIY